MKNKEEQGMANGGNITYGINFKVDSSNLDQLKSTLMTAVKR